MRHEEDRMRQPADTRRAIVQGLREDIITTGRVDSDPATRQHGRRSQAAHPCCRFFRTTCVSVTLQ